MPLTLLEKLVDEWIAKTKVSQLPSLLTRRARAESPHRCAGARASHPVV
jgi:hypothetical protein